MEREDETLTKLMSTFRRTDPDGRYTFSDADVAHFLPYIVMQSRMKLADLAEPVQRLMLETAQKAGIKHGMSAEETWGLFRAYYEQNPPNPELKRSFEGSLRDIAAGGSQAATAGQFLSFLGAAATAIPTGGGKPPEGAVRGGVLARFTAQVLSKR